MEFSFACPFCSQRLSEDDTNVGGAVYCPFCRNDFLVPAATLSERVPMAPQAQTSAPIPNLEGEHSCPVCWLRFDGGDIMHIAVHDSLRGDPMLGEDAQQRFLATRFNNSGHGLDAMGLPCSDLACPHCRRKLPPGFLEMPHHIISIVGDQSSGKSYYLSVLTKVLPATLYRDFGVVFQDSDPTGNAPVNEMRKVLFGAQTPAQAKLAKTVFEGAMYERLPRQGRMVALPRPFVYKMARAANPTKASALIFYDNAGEHFQPGINIVEQPGAQHVATAAGILFLFDPFNSPEFRVLLKGTKDPQIEKQVVDQQDTILSEMRVRIQSIRNLRSDERISTPVAFVIGKSDSWLHLFKDDSLKNPLSAGKLDLSVVKENSSLIRQLLLELCPSALANVEALSNNVLFFAASSFGHTPVKIAPNEYVPDPAQLKPFFVEIPLLWMLSHITSDLLEARADAR